MLAIINEILTFKDRQIRASARLTIAKGTVHRAYGVRAMRNGDGLTGAPCRSSLKARGGERSACSTPPPLPVRKARWRIFDALEIISPLRKYKNINIHIFIY